jgi:hypothetical protein
MQIDMDPALPRDSPPTLSLSLSLLKSVMRKEDTLTGPWLRTKLKGTGHLTIS